LFKDNEFGFKVLMELFDEATHWNNAITKRIPHPANNNFFRNFILPPILLVLNHLDYIFL
jgi:hypothetical protein